MTLTYGQATIDKLFETAFFKLICSIERLSMKSHFSPRLNPILVALSVSMALGMTAQLAHASNMEILLERLHKKGVLTKEEYQEMVTLARAEKQQTTAEITKVVEAAKPKNDVVTRWKNGVSWESADGQHSLGLTGRMHFDYRDNSNDFAKNYDRDTATLASNFELRRARLGVKGFFYKDISYEVVGNMVGSNTNTIDTAWVNLGYYSPAQLRVGRFTQPFNLEEIGGSNSSDFLESSYVNQLTPATKLGVMVHGQPVKGFNYAVSSFQEGFSETTNETANGSQFAARTALNFADFSGMKDTVLHMGLSGTSGKYNVTPASSSQTSSGASTTTRATVVGFRTVGRGLSNIYRAQLSGDALSSGTYSGASNTDAEVDRKLHGLELAGSYGPWKLQAEWAKASLDALHQNSGSFVRGDVKASYAQLVWNVTGESWADAYKGGAFGSIVPKNNYKPGAGTGAWQLGLRYAKYDASGIQVGGGSAREQNADKGSTVTLGVNWILNPNAKLMLNYDKTKFKTPVTPLDVTLLPGQTNTASDEKVLSVRAQIAF
jgi:phosphate-selective porin OprO/OprP